MLTRRKPLLCNRGRLSSPEQVLVFVRIGGLDLADTGDVGNGSGPSDFCSCTLKVPRSAVGSGSGRPEPARPMSQLGRTYPFQGAGTKVWCRRASPVAANSGDRLLSKPKAGTQPWRREPRFMPHSGHWPGPPGMAQLGGNPPFPICLACGAPCLEAVIYCLTPHHPTLRLFPECRWQVEGQGDILVQGAAAPRSRGSPHGRSGVARGFGP